MILKFFINVIFINYGELARFWYKVSLFYSIEVMRGCEKACVWLQVRLQGWADKLLLVRWESR